MAIGIRKFWSCSIALFYHYSTQQWNGNMKFQIILLKRQLNWEAAKHRRVKNRFSVKKVIFASQSIILVKFSSWASSSLMRSSPSPALSLSPLMKSNENTFYDGRRERNGEKTKDLCFHVQEISAQHFAHSSRMRWSICYQFFNSSINWR